MTLKTKLKSLLLITLFSMDRGTVFAQPNMKTTAKIIFSDDFKKDKKNWVCEFETPATSSMKIEDGKLDVVATAGGTIWCKNKLQGNIMITYNVTVVYTGGKNDRVSDMNTFWMASNPSSQNMFNQSGKFESYDKLQLYYAGIGGHENQMTRFRKYDGIGGKDILKEFTDKEHLLVGNQKYTIKIIVNNGLVQYFVNTILFWEYKDASPYNEGYFGFRTYISHQVYENFKVYQL